MSTGNRDASSRPSRRQRLAELLTDDNDESTHDGMSSRHRKAMAWMRYAFREVSVVHVQFPGEEAQVAFPKAMLEENFTYFKAARNHAFVEEETGPITLKDITAFEFASILKYVRNRPEYIINPTVDERLGLIVAADYLGLVSFTAFEKKIARGLAFDLLFSRTRLTSDHTRLVASHNAFKSNVLWQVAVDSGVRPFLQEHLVTVLDCPRSSTILQRERSHREPETWLDITHHYKQLRAQNDNYALAVMREVPKTLKAGRERLNPDQVADVTAPKYLDPLLAHLSFTPEFEGFEPEFTI